MNIPAVLRRIIHITSLARGVADSGSTRWDWTVCADGWAPVLLAWGRWRRVYGPCAAAALGWEELHRDHEPPTWQEIGERLQLSDKDLGLLQRAELGLPRHSDRLRADLLRACGLTERRRLDKMSGTPPLRALTYRPVARGVCPGCDHVASLCFSHNPHGDDSLLCELCADRASEIYLEDSRT